MVWATHMAYMDKREILVEILEFDVITGKGLEGLGIGGLEDIDINKPTYT